MVATPNETKMSTLRREEDTTEGRMDCDTHADTCVLGKCFKVFEYTDQECEVRPYSDEYEPKTVKIASGLTAYDCSITKETYILCVHQGLVMPNQEPSLCCPNQIRANNNRVEDCPVQFLEDDDTRMMGVPIDGPANVFCDNESVVKSAARPESQLKKKHIALCYHAVRETIAHNIMRVAWEKGETNLADLLTKSLPGPRLDFLVKRLLH